MQPSHRSSTASSHRRLGFAVKVLGRDDLPSHDTRRWQSGPHVRVSIDNLHRILDYLGEEGIRMYRISSDFVPYVTHPELPRFHGQMEESAPELRELGHHARELDVRLSLHPSQYVVLNAKDPEIAAKAAWDLDCQARLLDVMDQPAEAVVVLHLGGLYGDREGALERFVARVGELTEAARRRLVIENDDRCFTVQDCLWVHERLGTPIVFDHHHHRLNPGDLELAEAARAALSTWPTGVVPKVHFSSPRLDSRQRKPGGSDGHRPPLLRQHADYVDPWTFADFLSDLDDLPFDVMLEAKAKDLAVRKLRADLAEIGRADVLRAAPTPKPNASARPRSEP